MKQNIRLFHNSSSLWDKFLESNPQLFREIKGKLKTRNVVIAAAISVMTQLVIAIYLLSDLPDPDPKGTLKVQYGRYGMGNVFDGFGHESKGLPYTKDMLGDWVINWQLLWLDLFIALSIIGIFTLLIVGTYMLIADVVKEDSRGTLNFIRLTPQSAGSILLGKILGAPILLYTVILLFLPLHLMAGLGAGIPLTLILAFDVVVVASCAFFYSLALLWSLMNFGVSGFKPWLASAAVGLFLFALTRWIWREEFIFNLPFDWLFLFNPVVTLSYLIDATYLPQHKINYLSVKDLGELSELSFYGQALWTKASLGIGFILFNFNLWTYWCWSILKRRFHNPENTLVSKTQSYWLTAWFVALALGFTLQPVLDYGEPRGSSYDSLSFLILQLCLYLFGLVLIAALSPHRQALHDWARYRHQANLEGNVLWKELILGENSPSTIAIAINLAMAMAYITPSIFLLLNEEQQHYIFWGFILNAGNVLLYAVVAQLVLTMKTRKRAVWSAISVLLMIVVQPLCIYLAETYIQGWSQLWLFGFIPMMAFDEITGSAVMLVILGQWLAIALVSLQMSRKLRQAGASETKILLSQSQSR